MLYEIDAVASVMAMAMRDVSLLRLGRNADEEVFEIAAAYYIHWRHQAAARCLCCSYSGQPLNGAASVVFASAALHREPPTSKKSTRILTSWIEMNMADAYVFTECQKAIALYN